MTAPAIIPRDIYEARLRLQPHLTASPLRASAWISSVTGASVALKLESLQLTHSFKIRGALNAVARLRESGGSAAVTASAGNHGRAMALAGERLGVRPVVFTPATAPVTKRAAIRRHGADLRDDAPDYDSAERAAREHAAATKTVFISPYNHADVIAGAGTVGLEILEQAPDVEVVIVPLGGGGLLAGLGIAVKNAAPTVKVIGVEVDASPVFSSSLAAGAITDVEVRPSLADGLIGNLEPGSMTFDLVRQYVDSVVSVSEADLRRSVRGLAEEEHLIVEGAGAAATAAALAQRIVAPGQRAVVLVTGGNIDLATFLDAVTV